MVPYDIFAINTLLKLLMTLGITVFTFIFMKVAEKFNWTWAEEKAQDYLIKHNFISLAIIILILLTSKFLDSWFNTDTLLLQIWNYFLKFLNIKIKFSVFNVVFYILIISNFFIMILISYIKGKNSREEK